jgi:hypothetical protein
MKLPALFVVRDWMEFFLLLALVITLIGCWQIFPTDKHIDRDFLQLHRCKLVMFRVSPNAQGYYWAAYTCGDGINLSVEGTSDGKWVTQ